LGGSVSHSGREKRGRAYLVDARRRQGAGRSGTNGAAARPVVGFAALKGRRGERQSHRGKGKAGRGKETEIA